MPWFPDSVHCVGCGAPIYDGGAERCAACAPEREADDLTPHEKLIAYWEDCYWPTARMKVVVYETLGDDAYHKTDITHRAGLFLFGCAIIGPYAPWVSIATGLDRRECCWFGIQARRAKIITARKVDTAPWVEGDPQCAALSFVLDAMVTAGRIHTEVRDGERRYYAGDSIELTTTTKENHHGHEPPQTA